MKQLAASLLPLDGMPVHHRVPSMKQLGVSLFSADGILVHCRVASMKQLGVLLHPLDGMLVTQCTQHEATRSITILCGWDASPLQSYPQYFFP